MLIPTASIIANPEQPRKVFDVADLQALVQSIKEHGVIQPPTVEDAGDGTYILHDGERRWRAAQLAGLSEIECSVVPGLNGTGKRDRLARAVIANVCRADMRPIEEARAYQKLHDIHGWAWIDIARSVGRSPEYIKYRVELLELDPEIQALIEAGEFPVDVYVKRALMNLEPFERIELAQKAAGRRMSASAIIKACGLIRKRPTHFIPGLRSEGEPTGWNALAQVGKLPPWEMLKEAVNKTCEECPLRSMASRDVCGECPLPLAVDKMVRSVKK